MTQVIVPEENRKDVEELADFIREGIEVKYATECHQVVEWAFGGMEGLREVRGEEVGEEEVGGWEIRGIDEVESRLKKEKRKKRERKPREPKGKGPVVPIEEPPAPSGPTTQPTEPIIL